VFDTIPLLAVIAGLITIVGQKNEQTKWRIIGLAMLSISLVVGAIFGFSIYTYPVVGLFQRYFG
jgi:presenilin-like A22 family membrane protease